MKYLAERLTAFLKDYDYFDYMDSMEIGETDADMVEKNKAMLNSPMMLRHSIRTMEEILNEGNLDDREASICRNLIEELKEVYIQRVSGTKPDPQKERSAR